MARTRCELSYLHDSHHSFLCTLYRSSTQPRRVIYRKDRRCRACVKTASVRNSKATLRNVSGAFNHIWWLLQTSGHCVAIFFIFNYYYFCQTLYMSCTVYVQSKHMAVFFYLKSLFRTATIPIFSIERSNGYFSNHSPPNFQCCNNKTNKQTKNRTFGAETISWLRETECFLVP